MQPHVAFRREAQAALERAVREVGHEGPVPPLEVPPDPTMGDLGMPCFMLAKTLRQAPAAIAAALAGRLEPAGMTWVVKVQAAGPYVNLVLDRRKLAAAVLADPAAALAAPAVPGKVLLEHTSANPNGPLHVGRARNPIVGDTLVRLLRAAGHDVTSQYYMDNLGRQVALLYWGARHIDPATLPAAARDKPDHRLVRFYQAANERMSDPAVAAEVAALVARLEEAEPDLLADVRTVYEACFAGMQESLTRLGVTYDSIKDESDLVASGAVADVIARLQRSPRAAQEADGAWYLDLSDALAGQKDRFYFTRKDGTSVYATRDVAYHAWKRQAAGADGRLVDVLGEDHRLQSLQVRTALQEIDVAPPTVVFYAFVSLPEGKMSTRANRVVFLDDLLDEAVARARDAVRERRGDELGDAELDRIAEAVGIAAVRFNIARIQPEKPIEFRWEEALSFDGDSAPYLLYAHARAASLLRKAHEAGLAAADAEVAAARISDGDADLLELAARLPVRAAEAADRLAPHTFCAYALQLATAFNEYYRDHRVVGEDAAVAATRLAVVAVAKDALARALGALGLPVLDAM